MTLKRSEKKLKLTRGEKIFHYSILICLAVMPAMSFYYLFRYFVLTDYTGLREPINFYIIGIVGITLMALFYIIQNRRLRFLEIEREISDKDLEIAIGQCSVELEWQIIFKTKDKIVATRNNDSI